MHSEDQDEIMELLQQADIDGDGSIDFQVHMLMTICCRVGEEYSVQDDMRNFRRNS